MLLSHDTHYSVLISCYSMLTYIWVVSRNPLLADLSSLLSCSCSLLAVCWSVVAAYCSILAIRFMVLAHINVRCSWIAVADCVLCIHPLAICFRWRYSLLEYLYDVCSMLLPFVIDNLLLARCYFFAICWLLCCPLTVQFFLLADWSLVTRPVPLIASWLNAYYMSLAIPRSLLRFTVRFLAFVSGKSPLAPRRLF